MLGVEELDELLDELYDRIRLRVIEANRRGTLDELLESMGMAELVEPATPIADSYKDGKIVVIGESAVKEEELRMILGKEGIDKDRLECCLSYEGAKSYEYRKLQYNSGYRLVLFGPIPHKTEGTGDSSSAIAELENNAGYPRVERLTAGGQLKITKTNFKNTIKKLKAEGYI